MRRRVLHVPAAISLTLFLLTAVAWPRSYWVRDVIEKQTVSDDGNVGEKTHWIFFSQSGSLMFIMDWERTDGARSGATFPLRWWTGRPDARWMMPIPDSSLSRIGADGSVHTGRGWSLSNHGFGTVAMELATRNGLFFSGREYVLRLPHWLLMLVLAVLPAVSGRQLYRNRLSQRRISAGLCAHCGYDLRASPERCPECGTGATIESKA